VRQRVAEAVENLEPAADRKGLVLRLEVSDDVPEKVTTDPLRLWQVVSNLVGNSIKFSEQGVVLVRVRREASDGLAIEVEDTGAGTSEGCQARLFRPCAQGDETISRRFGGTGLGLALSRGLCRAMGGDLVLVRSAPGEGSVFRATFFAPAPQEKETAGVGDPAKRAPIVRDAAHPLAGLRILLVEDAEDNRLLISTILQRAGAETATCINGEEALSEIERGFDLVLMDIQMPKMDGMEATQRLREGGHRLPIVALTAHAMRGERERCLSHGFTDYVTKPVHRKTLIERIAFHALAR
jgi:CheY-like chemotaxis protein